MINRGLLATAAVGAALVTGACGGSDDSRSGGPRPKADLQTAALKFSRCMREHGIDMPDPQNGGADGTVLIGGGPGNAKFNPDSPAFKTAEKACKKYLDAVRPNLTPAQEAEAQQQMLKTLRCLREHGVDIPDSAAAGGGLKIGPDTGVNPRDPAFQRAQKACMKDARMAFQAAPKP